MGTPSSQRLIEAWRALDAINPLLGWNTLPLRDISHPLLLAGRYHPTNQESLLFCFNDIRLPDKATLPQCKGFTLDTSRIEFQSRQYSCLVLTRQISASVELFAVMATDVIALLERGERSEQHQVRALLERVVAWQKFMSREDDGLLKGEEELGLVGELQFLRLLLSAGVLPVVALEWWKGPFDALHDFVCPLGDLEVKSSIRAGSFIASISSLDQLDETLVAPLFLAAVQFGLSTNGLRLPELAGVLTRELSENAEASKMFQGRLITAGYHDYAAPLYHRQFSYLITNIYEVGPLLPRLSRGTVPKGVVEAVYRIELDTTRLVSLTLADVLPRLGHTK
jgi:hypothetical protein